MDDKRFFLEGFINNHLESKMLIFVRTKVRAERVKKAMERVGLITDTIHSDREHSDREKIMKNFRSGDLKVLIATDVSARGIDIPNVEYVINYDLPETAEQYVHRVGRTGRGTQKGQAYSFSSIEEKDLLKEIEENLGKPISRLIVTKDEYQLTVDNSKENPHDWQALIDDAEEFEVKKRKAKAKKKAKKK